MLGGTFVQMERFNVLAARMEDRLEQVAQDCDHFFSFYCNIRPVMDPPFCGWIPFFSGVLHGKCKLIRLHLVYFVLLSSHATNWAKGPWNSIIYILYATEDYLPIHSWFRCSINRSFKWVNHNTIHRHARPLIQEKLISLAAVKNDVTIDSNEGEKRKPNTGLLCF